MVSSNERRGRGSEFDEEKVAGVRLDFEDFEDFDHSTSELVEVSQRRGEGPGKE